MAVEMNLRRFALTILELLASISGQQTAPRLSRFGWCCLEHVLIPGDKPELCRGAAFPRVGTGTLEVAARQKTFRAPLASSRCGPLFRNRPAWAADRAKLLTKAPCANREVEKKAPKGTERLRLASPRGEPETARDVKELSGNNITT
jgi:hypothetical protein